MFFLWIARIRSHWLFENSPSNSSWKVSLAFFVRMPNCVRPWCASVIRGLKSFWPLQQMGLLLQVDPSFERCGAPCARCWQQRVMWHPQLLSKFLFKEHRTFKNWKWTMSPLRGQHLWPQGWHSTRTQNKRELNPYRPSSPISQATGLMCDIESVCV